MQQEGSHINPEINLWKQFKKGDDEAFSTIYAQHIKLLLAYGNRLTPDTRIVEDCIHDLFLELWNRKDHLHIHCSLKLYLLKGLKRKIIQAVQNQRQKESAANSADAETEKPYEFFLIQQQNASDLQYKLSKAMDKLTDHQREVIYLKFYAAMDHQEIAEVMVMNIQSVHNLVYRTIKMLRKEINSTDSLSPLYLYVLLFLITSLIFL
jgi:RNA polymerase sigma factor (sigma-70 family)